MMKAVTELFNGGVVTARVGALLESGELQRADDCFYREKDPAIWRAPGRTALTASALPGFRGMKHLSFDGSFTEQMLFLGRQTSGSPTWTAGQDPVNPASHLYAGDFTAISGITQTEIGGAGRVKGVVSSTSFEAGFTVASCTISGTTVTSSAGFANIDIGMVVSGTGVTAGTRVLNVTDASTLTLDTSATSGTVTLTFRSYPFLATAVGAQISGTSVGTNIIVTAVSNQDGTTGHYRTATLSAAPSGGDGTYSLGFSHGLYFNFGNAGTEILDAIQFNSRRYFVWDGAAPASAIEWRDRSSTTAGSLASILSARPIGLQPVVIAPTITAQTGQSTGWSTVQGAGTYWILITEIFSPNGNIAQALLDPVQKLQIVESAYLGVSTSTTSVNAQGGAGLPQSVTITTVASDNVLITFPAVVNNGDRGYLATHWGIYIYGPSPSMPSLASMRRCATVPITTYAAGATYTLTDQALTQQAYSTVARAVTGYSHQFSHADHITGGLDNEYGSTKSTASSAPVFANAAQGLTTFGLVSSGGYAGKTVIGVEVHVHCRVRTDALIGIAGAAGATMWCQLMNSGGSRKTGAMYRKPPPYTNRDEVFGGPMDTMNVAWTLADTTGFEVEIGIVDSSTAAWILDLFDVYIKVYYTSINVDFAGPAYRVVTYRDQVGNTVSDPARLLPPRGSTGDFFQGCLVFNDLDQPNTLRYSLPDDPEAWPKPYRLTFNTRKRDKINFIRAFNGILFVGMESTVKRVMYLPRETDTDMTSGLAHEDIATDHGIPGPFCATLFDLPGKGVFMAYISPVGIFVSNGIWTMPLNMDLDWEGLVKVSALSTSILKNYPRQKMLAFYYCPAGATHSRNTRVMYFSYQQDKMKGDFQLPAIGPSVVSARAAAEAYLNNTPYIFTANEGDNIAYVEDSGISIPSGYQVTLTATASTQGDGKAASGVDVKIIPLIRTRKFFSATMDRDQFGEKVYLMFSPYGTAGASIPLCVTTKDSTTITNAFGGFVLATLVGSRIKGTAGVDPGTIILTNPDSGTITVSRAANADTSTSITPDTGTVCITCRGSGLGEAVKGLSHDYVSTLAGDLVSIVNMNIRRGFELQIEKVPLTFDSNGDTLTWADLGTNMRLHSLTFMQNENGLPDTNRNTT